MNRFYSWGKHCVERKNSWNEERGSDRRVSSPFSPLRENATEKRISNKTFCITNYWTTKLTLVIKTIYFHSNISISYLNNGPLNSARVSHFTRQLPYCDWGEAGANGGGDRRHHSFPTRGLWLWGVALPPSVRPKPIPPPPPTPVSEPSPVKTGGKEGEIVRTSEAGGNRRMSTMRFGGLRRSLSAIN